MKLNLPLTATALALACGLSNAVTLRVAESGRRAVDGSAFAQRDRCSSASPATSTSRWSAAARTSRWCRRWPPSGSRPRRRCGASSCARASSSTTARRSPPTTWCSRSSARQSDGSDMKGYTSPIKEVRKVGDYAVDIETNAPFPILPDTLTTLYMHEQEVVRGQQGRAPGRPAQGHRERGLASRPTAPARSGCKERQPSARTVIVRNSNYWDKVEGNVDEVIFTPIGNDATRVAALLSGEIDVMEPVPLQDVERVKAARQLHRAAGARAAHHLPRHGPEARRAAVLQRQGQEPVQGQARAPGVLPGDRHRGDQVARDARRRDADRPDDRRRACAASSPT